MDLRQKAAGIEQAIQQRTAQAASYEAFQQARNSLNMLEDAAVDWKGLTDVLEDLVKELVEAQVAEFVTRVQQHLPAKDVFAMTLEPFRFGFMKDGKMRIALSGAQWVRALCAIGSALAVDQEFAVLIPEERSYDENILVTVMEGLSQSPLQVILTSTTPPASIPEGWTVIYTTNDEGVTLAPMPKKTAARKVTAKKVESTLKELGWTASTILGMREDTKAFLAQNGGSPSQFSVTSDGQFERNSHEN